LIILFHALTEAGMGNHAGRATSDPPPDNVTVEKRIYPLLAIPFSSDASYFTFGKSVCDGRLVNIAKDLYVFGCAVLTATSFDGVDPTHDGGTSVSWTKFVPVYGESIELNFTFAVS
jgi:hypothetical protein